MINNFELNKTTFGTMIDYKRGKDCDVYSQDEQAWQQTLSEKFDTMLENQNDTELSKANLEQIFSENSTNYIMAELSKYLSSLKDINGNDIDFNSLDTKQQKRIVEFLQKPLEDTYIYGTRASLSDIKIDISNDDNLYIEANIHTIDGQILSTATQFIPANSLNTSLEEDGFIKRFEGDDTDYSFSFTTSQNLSIDEKKALLRKIQGANFKDYNQSDEFNDFDGNIEIGVFFGDSGSRFPQVQISNLKLNLETAAQNVKNIPKEDAEEKNDTKISYESTLLKILWDKIKSEMKDFDLIKTQQENKLLNQQNIKNPEGLLKSLLAKKKE